MKKLTVLILALSTLFSLLCLASCDSDGGTDAIKENERLAAQLADLTKAYNAIEAELSAIKDGKALDDTKISGLEAELKAAKDKNTADTAKIEGLEAELAAAKAQDTANTKKIEGLEAELKAAKEQNAADAAKIATLEANLKTAKDQKAAADAEIASLEARLKTATEQNTTDTARIQALEAELAAAKDKSSTDSAKITALESELAAAKDKNTTDSATIAALEAELKAARAQKALDDTKIATFEAQLKTAKEQNTADTARIQALEAELDAAKDKSSTDSAKITALESELATAKDKNATDSAKITALEAELTAAKDKTSNDAKTIEALETELAAAKDKNATDSTKIATLEAELKKAKDQKAYDDAKISNLKARLEAAKEQNAADAAKIKELEDTVASLQKELDELVVTVTFSVGDGATPIAAQRIVNGGYAEEPDVPEKHGFVFMGWYLNGEKFDFSTPVSEDITLSADWVTDRGQYSITGIKIDEKEISDYTLITDLTGTEAFSMEYINGFRAKLYDTSGYSLNTDVAENASAYTNRFIIRYVEYAGADGFRAYATKNDFIVECAYANAFDKSFTEMIDAIIFDKTGYIKIPSDYSMTDHVSTVKYSEFGAKGDGATEDWTAIYNTHVYANQCGQKVYGDIGATYYIWNFTKTIPVKTDTDFNGATFLINDLGDDVYNNRTQHLFTIAKEHSTVTINSSQIKSLFPNNELLTSDTCIKWLADAGYLPGEWNMVRFTNDHKDFIRHGSNINSGNDRTDIVIADSEGNLHEDTPAIFDFKAEDQLINNGLQYRWYRVKDGKRHNFTRIEIFRVDDEPITVENGYFERTVCQTVSATEYKNKYSSYRRAIYINRSNATLKNLKHRLVGEPTIVGQGKDSDGNYKQSYPYYGFLFFTNAYNSTAQDCNLTGHTTYYEAKTTSSSPVAMGTYDIVIEYSSHITLKNVIQNDADEVFLGDSHYWGIMSSNGAKNMFFEDCAISRFDAHRGFWNSTLKNCVIGQYINVMGGGNFLLDNVRKLVGANFMSMRGDYGASFRGDITMKNCTLDGHKTYNNSYVKNSYYTSNLYVINTGFKSGSSDYKGHYQTGNAAAFPYLKWDFGYTCYMPQNVVVENFKLNESCTAPLYLYNNIGNYAFVKPDDFITEGEEYHIMQYTHSTTGAKYDVKTTIATEDIYYNQYQITKSITYKNMAALPTCPAAVSSSNSYYSKILSVPITVIND